MNTLEIGQNISVLQVYNEIDVIVNKVTNDTRKIDLNDCYVGIKGEKKDGNLLYMEAFLKGASLVVLDSFEETEEVLNYLKENNKMIILVQDSIEALGEIAKLKRNGFKNPVVAITGSAGKTSTKDMVYSVLNEKYNAHKTIGNQNNHIGLPLSILSLEEKNEIMVLEMGMNHRGEIAYLTSIAQPDVAIITNVGTAHIGNLGSRENILKAKLEILEGLKPDGLVIINNDNDLLHEWYLENKNKYNIITVGFKNASLYMADNIQELEQGSTFTCMNEEFRVPVGGEHFVYNALVAIAVGEYFQVPIEDIKKGILNFELSSNRMSIKELPNQIMIIDDSYNANYDSMSYAIKYLGSLEGRNIAILGSMMELGSYSKELHENIGKLISQENIDLLITVGNDAKYINEAAHKAGMDIDKIKHFVNNQEVITYINALKQPGDNILIKASNSLHFKEIVEGIN